MAFSQLRREVNALMRKYATEHPVHKLRPAAGQYCDQWQELIEKKKLPPTLSPLFQKLPGKDFLRRYFPPVNIHLDDCRLARRLPLPNQILRFLITKAADRCLVPVPRCSVAR